MEKAIKIRCPNCGSWIYVMEIEKADKNEGNHDLHVEIVDVKRNKKKAMYYAKDVPIEEMTRQILDRLIVSAHVNGTLYRFEIWIAKKQSDGWVGGIKAYSRFMQKEKAKDVWVDENNEMFVKQKFGIMPGFGTTSRVKLSEKRMKEIAEKLGLELRTGKEGLRLYLGEKYSENLDLSRNLILLEKLIKVWLAFWEPSVV